MGVVRKIWSKYLRKRHELTEKKPWFNITETSTTEENRHGKSTT